MATFVGLCDYLHPFWTATNLKKYATAWRHSFDSPWNQTHHIIKGTSLAWLENAIYSRGCKKFTWYLQPFKRKLQQKMRFAGKTEPAKRTKKKTSDMILTRDSKSLRLPSALFSMSKLSHSPGGRSLYMSKSRCSVLPQLCYSLASWMLFGVFVNVCICLIKPFQ